VAEDEKSAVKEKFGITLLDISTVESVGKLNPVEVVPTELRDVVTVIYTR
jgi:hypothetical protein